MILIRLWRKEMSSFLIIQLVCSSIALICIIGLTIIASNLSTDSNEKTEMIRTLCHRLDLVNSGIFNTTPVIHVQSEDICDDGRFKRPN